MPNRFKVHDGLYPHFVTSTVLHWIPVFCRADYFMILADSLVYCAEHKGLMIHAYVLMPNHFHMICSQPEGLISDVMRDLKRHTSTTLLRKLDADGRHLWLRAFARNDASHPKVWQDAFHPEQVHSHPFFEQKANYIHANPVRAGYVEEAEHWKHSSAGVYQGDGRSVIPITFIEW